MAKILREESDHLIIMTEDGDTLWSLAEKLLGSGSRYPELVVSNPGEALAKHAYVKSGAELKIPKKGNGV